MIKKLISIMAIIVLITGTLVFADKKEIKPEDFSNSTYYFLALADEYMKDNPKYTDEELNDFLKKAIADYNKTDN